MTHEQGIHYPIAEQIVDLIAEHGAADRLDLVRLTADTLQQWIASVAAERVPVPRDAHELGAWLLGYLRGLDLPEGEAVDAATVHAATAFYADRTMVRISRAAASVADRCPDATTCLCNCGRAPHDPGAGGTLHPPFGSFQRGGACG